MQRASPKRQTGLQSKAGGLQLCRKLRFRGTGNRMNAKRQTQSAAPLPLAGYTWQFEDITLTRIIESEEPLLSPFELCPHCTQQDIDGNISWLAPDFYAQGWQSSY
jgi:hypothetical protein